MSKIVAVIGSGYGDEGKGLMTDYYASKMDGSIVVRSNGGAQAGHTVVTPEGKRHVFSHFGSGTFTGTPTYLSEHFVANPLLFKKEMEVLRRINSGIIPVIFANPSVLITTPFDMLLNQRFETDRGGKLHGSVGVGFGETIERSLVHSSMTLQDVLGWKAFGKNQYQVEIFEFLNDIREQYIPTRVNLNKVRPEFLEILNNNDLIYDFIDQLDEMIESFQLITDYGVLSNVPLIFEGAQGLQLDMDYGYFPHVTRSNCGMKNISKILEQIPGDHDVTAHYVTRAYTTRHGAGPLNGERALPHEIVDKTNIPNEFQGDLRFAPLDTSLFNSVTNKDFLNYAPRGATTSTVITCLDQLAGNVQLIQNERLEDFHTVNFIDSIKKTMGGYLSYGPTRDDVTKND